MEHQCLNSLHDLLSLEIYTLLCRSRRMEEDRQRDTADIVKQFVSLKAKAIEMDPCGIVQRQIWWYSITCLGRNSALNTTMPPYINIQSFCYHLSGRRLLSVSEPWIIRFFRGIKYLWSIWTVLNILAEASPLNRCKKLLQINPTLSKCSC